MTQEEFEHRILELTMPKDGDPEYERKETEAVNLVKMLVWDATQKGGGKWDNNVGAGCFKQFEWLHNQP